MAQYYVGSFSADSNELYHHGIKGQKWGIRRFQNKDGSLTEAGVSRYRYNTGAFGPGRKRSKEAREELGLNLKRRKNTATENRIAAQYASVKKAADKREKKVEIAKSKGFEKDVEKGRRAVESLEKELSALKMELKNYRSLPEAGRKSIDRGYKVANALLATGYIIGGYPFATASAVTKLLSDRKKNRILRGN